MIQVSNKRAQVFSWGLGVGGSLTRQSHWSIQGNWCGSGWLGFPSHCVLDGVNHHWATQLQKKGNPFHRRSRDFCGRNTVCVLVCKVPLGQWQPPAAITAWSHHWHHHSNNSSCLWKGCGSSGWPGMVYEPLRNLIGILGAVEAMVPQ